MNLLFTLLCGIFLLTCSSIAPTQFICSNSVTNNNRNINISNKSIELTNRRKKEIITKISNVYKRTLKRIKLPNNLNKLNNSTLNTVSTKIRPIRDASFWLRAGRIYSSYKLTQVKNSIKRIITRKSDLRVTNETWDFIHELNSQRMIRLCLGLKGFYLKTGQFLGTRHDFMPSTYTRKLSRLHDDVPSLSARETRRNIEKEINGTIEVYYTALYYH